MVPGCVRLDPRRHGLIPDPFYGSNELDIQWIEHEDWTYRTVFDLDGAFLFAPCTGRCGRDGGAG